MIFFTWFYLRLKLFRALAQAGIMVDKPNSQGKMVHYVLPYKVKLKKGEVWIKNHPKLESKLEDFSLSSALGKYSTESHYLRDDGNWWIFEIEKANIDHRYYFNDIDELRNLVKKTEKFHFVIDKRTTLPLHHMLVTGGTGSGKTWSVNTLILECLLSPVKHHLYFADPKELDLSIIGEVVAPEHTASDETGILELLEDFNAKMIARQSELRALVKSQRKSLTYAEAGLEPYVLIFDEYSAFSAGLDRKEAKRCEDRMKVLVQKGRQAGFFVWVLMQKSDATTLPTAIRANLPCKIVLGNASKTTYQTTFESQNVPKRKYKAGQGVFTMEGITDQPRLISFPTLNFEPIEVAHQLMEVSHG